MMTAVQIKQVDHLTLPQLSQLSQDASDEYGLQSGPLLGVVKTKNPPPLRRDAKWWTEVVKDTRGWDVKRQSFGEGAGIRRRTGDEGRQWLASECRGLCSP